MAPAVSLADQLAALACRMSDAQLHHSWRSSFDALQERRTTSEKLLIVALRQSFLDAIETRNRRALTRWLADDPSPWGGPDLVRRWRSPRR